MTRDERMGQFRARIGRLRRAAAHDWPAPVVCLALRSCLKSAILLYGERGVGVVSELLLESVRESAGLCPFDGNAADPKKAGMCDDCWKQAAEDDEAAGLTEERGE